MQLSCVTIISLQSMADLYESWICIILLTFEETRICKSPLNYLRYVFSYTNLQYFIKLYCFE